MRKFLISVAAAGSALALAARASTQWAPPAYQYQPYNRGNGFSGHRVTRSMETRVQHIRNNIRDMQARRILGWREARQLDNEARQIQRRIFFASRNGIQPGEARNVERQIRRLAY